LKFSVLYFYLFLVFSSAFYVHAQVDTTLDDTGLVDVAKLEYVDYSQNHFYGDSNSPRFLNFYDEFDQMLRYKRGQLNIVHFGGSHIQADVWSNLLRERLQHIDTNAQGARGIVFPYKAAGTNAPSNYSVKSTGTWTGHRSSYSKHKSTWGVLGITASTVDTLATLKFKFEKSKSPVHFNRVVLMTNAAANAYEVSLRSKDTLRASVVNETADGYLSFEFFQPLDSIEFVFTKNKNAKDTLLFYGLLLENDAPGIVYHSIGVNGSSFMSYQKCSLFSEQLAYLKPDMVIVSIGTNDTSEPDFDSATYSSNYAHFIEQIRAINANCAFVLTVPNDSYIRSKYHNENVKLAREVIFKLATKYDCKVWDMYSIMGGATSAKRWKAEGMMRSDMIHFTREGYLLKGDLFYHAFRQDYLKWFNGRQPVWND